MWALHRYMVAEAPHHHIEPTHDHVAWGGSHKKGSDCKHTICIHAIVSSLSQPQNLTVQQMVDAAIKASAVPNITHEVWHSGCRD